MAGAGVTMTGFKEFTRGVDQLPKTVSGALRSVAERIAHRVRASAKTRLDSQTQGTGATARALRVTERDQMKAFIVDVGPVAGRPDNLPLWLELGTVKMSARPFLRPAMEEHHAGYIRESDAAVQSAVEGSLK